MTYTFVTVAHPPDLPWLGLQARSMQRYLPDDLVSEVLVVENPRPQDPPAWRVPSRADYGRLKKRVRMVPAREIAEMPPGTGGWFSQQILKLMVSHLVTTERYVLLDAKNHLAFPLTRGFLEVDTKILSRRVSYERHPLRPHFERTLRYFGLDPAECMRSFLPTTTPFTLPAEVARAVVREVALREKRPFPEAFLARGLAEFFAVGAFLSTGGRRIEDVYDLSGVAWPTVWEETATRGSTEVTRLIEQAEADGLPFFALHRRAAARLDTAARRAVAGFWYRRRLFDDVGDGLRFLDVAVGR